MGPANDAVNAAVNAAVSPGMKQGAHRRIRRGVQLLSVLLLAGAVACESSSAPEPEATLDAVRALQDRQAMEEIFASEGWRSFQALGGRTPLSGGASLTALRALPSLMSSAGTPEDGARAFAHRLFRDVIAAHALDAPSAVVVISDTYRGKTLVFDPLADEYVVDATRTGAPANGVRFILYEVDETDTPIGGEELGYTDVVDEGTSGNDVIVLRLVAVQGNRTMLDYRTRVTVRDGFAEIGVDGFAVDGSNRLNFDIDATGETVGGRTTMAVDFDLRMSGRDFSIVGAVSGVENGVEGDGTVQLTVRHGQQSLGLDVTGDGQQIDGEILLDGRLFVTVSGDAANPTLRNAFGDSLSGRELLAVLAIIDTSDDVFQLVEDLLQPVDNLLVLGFLL